MARPPGLPRGARITLGVVSLVVCVLCALWFHLRRTERLRLERAVLQRVAQASDLRQVLGEVADINRDKKQVATEVRRMAEQRVLPSARLFREITSVQGLDVDEIELRSSQ